MRLADAGRAGEDDVLGTLDEKARLASSWICWRGTPVAKPKLEPSCVLTVGKPATRANISPGPAARNISSRKSVKEASLAAAL